MQLKSESAFYMDRYKLDLLYQYDSHKLFAVSVVSRFTIELFFDSQVLVSIWHPRFDKSGEISQCCEVRECCSAWARKRNERSKRIFRSLYA